MISKFAVLSNILLASTVLAAPSSRLETHVAHRRNHRHLGVINRDESSVDYNYGWSGAYWDENDGTFTTVTGTFTVPDVTGPDGVASAWVGIDGLGCGQGLLQAGIDFIMTNGQVWYDAWYEWYPDWSYNFPTGISLSPGDVIRTTVTASSPTSGTAIMENLTTNQIAKKELTSSYSLCQQSAEWIVEDQEGGDLVPLSDFGTVTFTDAIATGPSGKFYTPSGAIIADIQLNGTVYTSVTTEGSTVTIKYT